MSSNIIPGVYAELGFQYLASYNDPGVKLMFTVCEGNGETQSFFTCLEADSYANSLLQHEGYNHSLSIYLNQVNGPRLLNEDEILSLAAFEADDQLYSMFQIYADKMSRHGRAAALVEVDEECEFEEDDTEEDVAHWNAMVTKRCLPDRHMKDISAKYEEEQTKEVDWIRWSKECERLAKSSLEDELLAKLHDANQKIVQLQKKGEKSQRDLAMEWIMNMNPEEFEQRLISNTANYKLPDFPRAQPGDEDYPDFSKPQRQIAAPDYKYILTPEEHDLGKSNYALINRADLLYMSVEEYKAIAYDEVLNVVFNRQSYPMRDTGVSDFDVYG